MPAALCQIPVKKSGIFLMSSQLEPRGAPLAPAEAFVLLCALAFVAHTVAPSTEIAATIHTLLLDMSDDSRITCIRCSRRHFPWGGRLRAHREAVPQSRYPG